jgi:ribonucleotide monophosphatase NagD (HAD superfamily)
MLLRLQEAGKKIYLLSNAQRIFTEYEMHTMDIVKYFDGILISSDYQTKKPDKRFFDILVEKYGIHPDKTLFVGNDSRTDIAGAKQVVIPQRNVSDLDDVESVVKENVEFIPVSDVMKVLETALVRMPGGEVPRKKVKSPVEDKNVAVRDFVQ